MVTTVVVLALIVGGVLGALIMYVSEPPKGFRGYEGQAGPPGPVGATGAMGPQGVPGLAQFTESEVKAVRTLLGTQF